MIIGTHSGVFHADETMACAILLNLYPSATIVRTRDPARLAECDVVVDVGGVYDDARKRYDHHQRGFDKARPNGIKYSSAGLVWFHYGMLVMDEFGPDAQAMWDDIDMNFIAAIDATDNGQRLNETPSLVRVQTLSSLIGAMNPTWLEETGNYPDGHFDAALELAKVHLLRAVAATKARFAARKHVEDALLRAHDGYLVLDHYMPWQEVVCSPMVRQDVLYVLFPTEEGEWRVQGVPKTLGGFEARKPLPESWGGLQGDAFAFHTGVYDAVFCHSARFICGTKGRVGAEILANMAVSS